MKSSNLLLSLETAILTFIIALALNSSRVSWKSLQLQKQTPAWQDGQEKYTDEDGEATDETQSDFSVKWQNLLLASVTIAGLAVALVNAILAVQNEKKTNPDVWLEFAAWVCHADLSYSVPNVPKKNRCSLHILATHRNTNRSCFAATRPCCPFPPRND
jgi:hypothetical protein